MIKQRLIFFYLTFAEVSRRTSFLIPDQILQRSPRR